MTNEKPIAVIGGGITGLVAAYTLRHERPWPPVIVIEKDARLGGKIKTTRFGDGVIEEGADSFLARDRIVVDLCTELGLTEELVHPAIFGAQVLSGDSLHPLPQGFLRGVPSSIRAALNSEILSNPGALRTAVDLVWPTRLKGHDVSFGRFVALRFGREVLDKLVSAVMSGTRAGIPEEVSLAAGAPELDAIARQHRSVMRGLRAVRAQGKLEAGSPPFRSLRPGLSRLIDTLQDHLGSVDIRTGTKVQALERSADGYTVVTDDERIEVKGAIVTTPARAAASVLRGIAPGAADRLDTISYSSSAAITLAYPAGSLELPDGSGLLVPAGEHKTISACTWFSRKWPHHFGDDSAEVVRAFIGRAGREGILDRADDELVDIAHKDLKDVVGVGAAPLETLVTRWDEALPQYAVGHLDTVAHIETELSEHSVRVAGAGLRGSGIPDCVRQGQAAARNLISAL